MEYHELEVDVICKYINFIPYCKVGLSLYRLTSYIYKESLVYPHISLCVSSIVSLVSKVYDIDRL